MYVSTRTFKVASGHRLIRNGTSFYAAGDRVRVGDKYRSEQVKAFTLLLMAMFVVLGIDYVH